LSLENVNGYLLQWYPTFHNPRRLEKISLKSIINRYAIVAIDQFPILICGSPIVPIDRNWSIKCSMKAVRVPESVFYPHQYSNIGRHGWNGEPSKLDTLSVISTIGKCSPTRRLIIIGMHYTQKSNWQSILIFRPFSELA